MTIGIVYRGITTELGPGGVFHALCSTISHNLEPNGWGTRFPNVLRELYKGRLGRESAEAAMNELLAIRSELSLLSPDKVVFDSEDPHIPPPWGTEVGPHVHNLSQYFVTNSGRNLLEELIEQVECLKDLGGELEIVSLGEQPIG